MHSHNVIPLTRELRISVAVQNQRDVQVAQAIVKAAVQKVLGQVDERLFFLKLWRTQQNEFAITYIVTCSVDVLTDSAMSDVFETTLKNLHASSIPFRTLATPEYLPD